ncbi:MAG: transglutaminase-like domain-containing protein [Firmicutes bacterium]|nr:transglutaminase-like domain-containing protein [Bacillota bacterium]
MKKRRREKRPAITACKIGDKADYSSLIYPVCLAAGVFSMLFFLEAADGMEFSSPAVYSFSLALSFILWFLYSKKRRAFAVFLAIFAALGTVFMILFRSELAFEIIAIIGYADDSTSLSDSNFTELVLLLSAAASLIIFLFEILLKNHVVIYLSVTALTFVSPIIGARLTEPQILLLLLFQVIFWTIQISERRYGALALKEGARARVTEKSVAFVALAAVLIFAVLTPVLSQFSDSFFGFIYSLETAVNRALLEASGNAAGHVTGGSISTGNNYMTGTVQLTITADKQPTEDIYLRGFGGGAYIGGNWIRSSDEGIFDIMIDALLDNEIFMYYYFGTGLDSQEYSYSDEYGQAAVLSIISSIYYSLYYEMNGIAVNEAEYTDYLTGSAEERTYLNISDILLNVQHADGLYDNYYVPYYSGFYTRLLASGTISDILRDDYAGMPSEGYYFLYYEQSDMMIDWDRMISDSMLIYSEEQTQMIEVYRIVEEAYMNVIKSSYTSVPTSILPRLTSLVEENPLDDLDEITAFILYTLNSRASYTRTPGWFPVNEDPIEYFLFEGGKGYCQHFACAATLMYRLYDIPARYATGYRVSASDFRYDEETGTWIAEVTDESAHAWVEIFISGYGWTPVEVTPSSGGTMSASYPGYDMSEFLGIVTREGWAMSEEINQSASISDGDAKSGSIFSLDFDSIIKNSGDTFFVIELCLLFAALSIPFFIAYRQLRVLLRLERMSCRHIFARYLDMIHYCGILTDYNGTEADFASRLSEALPEVSSELLFQMSEDVTRAAFGTPSESVDNKNTLLAFRETSKLLLLRLCGVKKFIFMYVKCWG